MSKWVRITGVACVLALAFVPAAAAQEKTANVAGKWEMTSEGRQGPVTSTLTFEQTGEKIKGTIVGQRGETPFEGTIKGNKLSFTVKRSITGPDGQTREFVQEYAGTVEGDAIKGTVTFTMQGNPVTREWTAKRQK